MDKAPIYGWGWGDVAWDVEDNTRRRLNGKRKREYGTCTVCARHNTNYQWCQTCDPKLLARSWTTSGNQKLDEMIRNTQLKAKGFDSHYYLEWISYDQLTVEKKIGQGGFGTVYKCYWSNGPRFVYQNKRYYCSNGNVALKELKDSQNISDEFLKELQNHIKFTGLQYNGIVNIYGISQNPDTKQYVLIMKYAADGSFRNHIESVKSEYTRWSDRLEMLYSISFGLSILHRNRLIHRDLHSGNILYFFDLPYKVLITDLGLSGPADQEPNSNDIFGVLPYVAPEVLNKRPYTRKSDIYSFGILMSEMSTYQQPFNDRPHDRDLVCRICNGLRPSFSHNTPKCYIELAYKCTNADPEQRPTAHEILKIITFWKDAFIYRLNVSEERLGELRAIREIFWEADRRPFNPSTIIATVHPNAVYTSRLLNFTNLPRPVNSNRVTIIDNNNVTHLMELNI